jgi:hypothetical protein
MSIARRLRLLEIHRTSVRFHRPMKRYGSVGADLLNRANPLASRTLATYIDPR